MPVFGAGRHVFFGERVGAGQTGMMPRQNTAKHVFLANWQTSCTGGINSGTHFLGAYSTTNMHRNSPGTLKDAGAFTFSVAATRRLDAISQRSSNRRSAKALFSACGILQYVVPATNLSISPWYYLDRREWITTAAAAADTVDTGGRDSAGCLWIGFAGKVSPRTRHAFVGVSALFTAASPGHQG